MKRLEISWLIVHHNNLSNLEPLVESLKKQGLDESLGIVVDNSENEKIEARIRNEFPNLNKLFIKNLGYANAVNLGIEELASRLILKDSVLVCTHDLIPKDNCVLRLVDQLQVSDQVAAVGPVLLGGSFGSERIWSSGGSISKYFGLPSHRHCGKVATSVDLPALGMTCDWLDGAMCLYRSDIFSQIKLDESYFLYFEETDFHAQIKSQGKSIVCATRAFASQKTSGIPGYWLGRNAYKFFKKTRPRVVLISFAIIAFLHLIRAAAQGNFIVEFKQVAKGFGDRHSEPVLKVGNERAN